MDTKKVVEPAPAPEPKKEAAKPAAKSGAVVPTPAEPAEEEDPLEPFGDLIPFADPAWYQGVRLTPFSCEVAGMQILPPTVHGYPMKETQLLI